MKHDIIYHPSTTDEMIADIPPQMVYEWVKTGKWRWKDFQRWLKVLRVI